MKSILLQVGDDPLFESRLQAALDLTRFVGGHLECLQIRRVPTFIDMDSIGYSGSAAMVVQLMDDEAKLAAEAREKLRARLLGEHLPFSFQEALGDPGQVLASRSLLADAIVMSLPPENQRDAARALAAAVTHADAPVVAIPQQEQRLALEKPVLVAWKPTREAALAVKRAVPLLRKAGRVDIVTIRSARDAAASSFGASPDAAPGASFGGGNVPPLAVAAYLSRHGVKSEVHERRKESESTSDAILAAAGELGSGLIVMGGYGRGRAMEFLLGGVTRRLLAASNVPLLLAH